MKRIFLPAFALAASTMIVTAPAHADVTIAFAKKVCASTAKTQGATSAKATSQPPRATAATFEVTLRTKTSDGAKAMTVCTIDRNTGEVLSLVAAE